MSASTEDKAAGGQAPSGPRRGLPRWKKVLLTVAVFLIVAGLGLHAYAWLRPAPDEAGSGAASSRRNLPGDPKSSGIEPSPSGIEPAGLEAQRSFVPWEGDPEGDPREGMEHGSLPGEKAEGPQDLSPVLFKGGMTFLVGFALGYALRAFARLSVFFVGIFLLALFGLSYIEAITIHWDIIQTSFDQAVASLKEGTADFQTFVAGSVPMLGMGGAGLFTGFKKN